MEKLVFDTKGLKQLADGEKKLNQQLFKKLKRVRPSLLDNRVNSLHKSFMGEMDCLSCGNCCKSLSPAVTDKDIERIAKYLKEKPSDIVTRYFIMDDEGDYVFPKLPCPFLGLDNYCSIYDARPRACREYPHTDRKRQHQLFKITAENIAVCPVVYEIVRILRTEFS